MSLKSKLQHDGAGAIANPLLLACARNGAKDLVAAIAENESEILADIQKTLENRESEDDPAKFKVSLSITLDLSKSVVDTAFSYSVKKTVKESHALPKEDEPELPWNEEEAA